MALTRGRRHLVQALAVLALAATMMACSSDDGDTSGGSPDTPDPESSATGDANGGDSVDSAATGADDEAASTAASLTAPPCDLTVEPCIVKTVTMTDTAGHEIQAEVRFTGWIDGRDAAAVERAWEGVGGTEPMPMVDGTPGVGYVFSWRANAYLFGTVSLVNLTPQHPASEFRDGFGHYLSVDLVSSSGGVRLGSTSTINRCTYYDSPIAMSDCANEYRTRGFVAKYGNLGDAMSWGPVPFVYSYPDVFVDRELPDGDPSFCDGSHLVGIGPGPFAYEDMVELGTLTRADATESEHVTFESDSDLLFSVPCTWNK